MSTEKTQSNLFLPQPTHRRAHELFQPLDTVVLYAALNKTYTHTHTQNPSPLDSLGRHMKEALPTIVNSEGIMVISDIIPLIRSLF